MFLNAVQCTVRFLKVNRYVWLMPQVYNISASVVFVFQQRHNIRPYSWSCLMHFLWKIVRCRFFLLYIIELWNSERQKDKRTIMATGYFTCNDLYASLTNCENILLLDCRGNEDYRQGHIHGSHNIVLPQLMMRRLKANKLPLKCLVPANFQQQKEVFLERCMSSKVVLYDNVTVQLNESDASMLGLLYRRMTSEGCDVFILKGK